MPFRTINTADLALAAVQNQLSDSDHGLNPRLQAALATTGVSLPSEFRLPLNFVPGSKNVFAVNVDPSDFGDSSFPYTFPMLTLFATDVADLKKEKFYTFAGNVRICVNLFVSWPSTKAPAEIETIMNAATNAIVATFNDVQYGAWSLLYDRRLVYNGDIRTTKSKVQMGGESWFQGITTDLLIEVHCQ